MKDIELQVEHGIGDTVSLALDATRKGMVVGYSVGPRSVTYRVCWANDKDSYHYGIEIVSISMAPQPIGFFTA